MNKRSSKSRPLLDFSHASHKKSLLLLRPYNPIHETTIPSRQETERRDKYLHQLHQWRQESRLSKLQQTYDQNCRIFISLKKQKSQYKLARKMTEKKVSYLKLAPLKERNFQIGPVSDRNHNKHHHLKTMEPLPYRSIDNRTAK